jgi:hypothetical protein
MTVAAETPIEIEHTVAAVLRFRARSFPCPLADRPGLDISLKNALSQLTNPF